MTQQFYVMKRKNSVKKQKLKIIDGNLTLYETKQVNSKWMKTQIKIFKNKKSTTVNCVKFRIRL